MIPSFPSDEPMLVKTGTQYVPISKAGFDLLFENSFHRTYVPIRRAMEDGVITLPLLQEHARGAHIPWTLFFAPYDHIAAQVQRKTDLLLEGTSKNTFSMNSRHEVRLADVELIVKDLLRRQEQLKRLDPTLKVNAVVGCLGNPRRTKRTVEQDANILRDRLGFTLGDLRARRKKDDAFQYLISTFEKRQLYVSRNQPGYMLQTVPHEVKFSGLTVKDNKIPYLFLSSGDEGDFEPAGRKIFTMILLAVLIGYKHFSPVTFEDKTGDGETKREYDVAGEVLMPAVELQQLAVPDLDSAREHADRYKVTPSAFVVRAWKLKLITQDEADGWLATLREEYANRAKRSGGGGATKLNAVMRYSGPDYFRRMVGQLREGRIDVGEFRRSVTLNHLSRAEIRDLAAAS